MVVSGSFGKIHPFPKGHTNGFLNVLTSALRIGNPIINPRCGKTFHGRVKSIAVLAYNIGLSLPKKITTHPPGAHPLANSELESPFYSLFGKGLGLGLCCKQRWAVSPPQTLLPVIEPQTKPWLVRLFSGLYYVSSYIGILINHYKDPY